LINGNAESHNKSAFAITAPTIRNKKKIKKSLSERGKLSKENYSRKKC
jgi:hypothetical protein